MIEAVILLVALFLSLISESVLTSMIDSNIQKTRKAVEDDRSILSQSLWARLCIRRLRLIHGLSAVISSSITPALCLYLWWLFFSPPLESVYFVVGFSILVTIFWARNSFRHLTSSTFQSNKLGQTESE